MSQNDMRELIAGALVDAALADGAPEPPPGLRARIMARVRGSHVYSIRAAEGEWLSSPLPGITMKVLSLDRERNTATLLVRGEPGAVYPAHHHSGPEGCYVLSGTVHVAGQVLHAGDYHHAEADSDHSELTTPAGAEVLLVVVASDYHL
jgi:quercetin dioxygenase-like cupin family protein